MKHILLTLIVILLAMQTFLLAQESWIPFNGGTEGEVELNILTSNNSEVIFTVNIPGMYVKDEMGYQRLRIEGCGKTDSTGFPELPLLKYLSAVPLCYSIIFSVQPLDSMIPNHYIKQASNS